MDYLIWQVVYEIACCIIQEISYLRLVKKLKIGYCKDMLLWSNVKTPTFIDI